MPFVSLSKPNRITQALPMGTPPNTRSNPDLVEAIKVLATYNVGFLVSHDVPGGQTSISLSAEELEAYVLDPIAFLAHRYGVTADQYLAWQQAEYRVLCAGRTKAGHPCKSTVPGGTFVSRPELWVRMQGRMCSVHA